jgi:hypothetical protein
VLHTDEKDYSDYMKHLSNLISVMSLFSGFMFTAYTILITRLPDPTNITAQLALYVLSTFLGIFLFILGFFATMALYSCRNLPPMTKRDGYRKHAILCKHIFCNGHCNHVVVVPLEPHISCVYSNRYMGNTLCGSLSIHNQTRSAIPQIQTTMIA